MYLPWQMHCLLKSNLWKHSLYLYLVLSLFLMSHSLSRLYLLRVTLYDYQALCWVFSESSDSGHTLLDVSTAFFFFFFTAHIDLCEVGRKHYVFLMSDQLFPLSLFSLALLCFLFCHEVDPDWACHVRLSVYVSVSFCPFVTAHACRTHALSWGLVRWPPLSDEVNRVFVTARQLYVCLRAPPHVWRLGHRWSRAVMATWCFLLCGCSRDAMLWLQSLPGWSVVATVHHGRFELSVLILQAVTVRKVLVIFFSFSIYVFDFPGMLCYALFCQDMNYHIWVSGLYVQVRTIQNFEVINFVRSELQGQNQNPIICMHKVIYDFTGLEESYKSEVEKTKSSDLSIKLIHHLKVHSVVLRSCYIYLYLPPPF